MTLTPTPTTFVGEVNHIKDNKVIIAVKHLIISEEDLDLVLSIRCVF